MTGRSPYAPKATARSARSAHGGGPPPPSEAKAAKPPEPERLDCEGQPLPPLQKRYPTVQVPRALDVNEQRVFETVASWVRYGRSSTATPLSEMIDDGDWIPPNIRLSHSKRSLAFWRICALRAVAMRRDQLEDFKALIEHIEHIEADDLALARGIQLAAELIQAVGGRERKFVKQHSLDQNRHEDVPQRELG